MRNVIIFDVGIQLNYEIRKDQELIAKNTITFKKLNKENVLKAMAKIVNQSNFLDVEMQIASPTALDSKTGFCKGVSAIEDYENFNLYEELGNLIKIKYQIKGMNDANCALKGFIIEETAHKVHSAIMIEIGSGIGAALYLNEKIWTGYDNMAGEIGYPLWKNGKNISFALSPANYFKKYNLNDISNLFNQYLVSKDITLKINEWLLEFTQAIAIFSFTINPEIIVFTGGIAKNKKFHLALEGAYKMFLKENDLDKLISTKFMFFDHNKNYKLIGARQL